jgi:hypothetical protein
MVMKWAFISITVDFYVPNELRELASFGTVLSLDFVPLASIAG